MMHSVSCYLGLELLIVVLNNHKRHFSEHGGHTLNIVFSEVSPVKKVPDTNVRVGIGECSKEQPFQLRYTKSFSSADITFTEKGIQFVMIFTGTQ